MARILFGEFRTHYLENLNTRSRTMSGKVHTGVSDLKLPLTKNGSALEEQLKKNLDEAARLIWEQRTSTAEDVRIFCERLATTLQAELIDTDGYRKKRVSLDLPQENELYRIWEVNYAEGNPKPREIHGKMLELYEELSALLKISRTGFCNEAMLVRIVAYADRQIDKIIHPWLDGCGRFATSIVMWLSLRLKIGFPRFGDRKHHYEAMEGLEKHSKYMLDCFRN